MRARIPPFTGDAEALQCGAQQGDLHANQAEPDFGGRQENDGGV